MITAILSMAVVWCLLYGRLAMPVLMPLCFVPGVVLALLGRHKHTQFLTIDVQAQSSRLNKVNPVMKFITVLILMVLCISAKTPAVGLFLTVAMLLLVVFAGGMKLHDYVHLLALPISFLLLSGLALLFEMTRQPTGVLHIPVFSLWFCISRNAQVQTALVIARALGAVSCLYLLSLTTPMAEIIGVLRRLHCPDLIIELMYLIYRYIFILLSMYHTMRDAAKSRLGYINYRTNVRTTGNLYSNLLSRSYRLAGRNFDAMESRCYGTRIRFLEKKKPVTSAHALAAAGIVVLTVCIFSL